MVAVGGRVNPTQFNHAMISQNAQTCMNLGEMNETNIQKVGMDTHTHTEVPIEVVPN